MSLECNECGYLMGPGDNLPGREGVLFYVKTTSKIWNFGEPEKPWITTYVQGQYNRSICFQCISDKIPYQQHDMLQRIFDSFTAEVRYGEFRKSNRVMCCDDLKSSSELWEKFLNEQNSIDQDSCTFCDNFVSERGLPIFMGIVIDKVKCSDSLGGLLGESNYQCISVEPGMTSFVICFECFAKQFAKTFRQLSYDIQNKSDPEKTSPKSEIFVSPEFFVHCLQELGTEETDRRLAECGAKIRPFSQITKSFKSE